MVKLSFTLVDYLLFSLVALMRLALMQTFSKAFVFTTKSHIDTLRFLYIEARLGSGGNIAYGKICMSAIVKYSPGTSNYGLVQLCRPFML